MEVGYREGERGKTKEGREVDGRKRWRDADGGLNRSQLVSDVQR